MKPNCFKCKHKRDIPGDANLSCHHPAFKNVHDNPMAELLGMFASVGRISPIQMKSNKIKVVGNIHGIRNGWFNHPLSFDPTWLDECNGFDEK